MSRIGIALALAFCSAVAAFAQTVGSVHGLVSDESGGVLPGVTVVAAAHDGRVFGTTTTDAVGAYSIEGLPAVPVRLSFQLDGFSAGAADVTIAPNSDVQVRQRLTVAARTENVTVVGVAPPPPAPAAPVLVPSLPPPVIVPVVEHARESVCGPGRLTNPAETFGTIRAKRFGAENDMYFAGDHLIVDRGSADGLAVAQNFVARRTFRTQGSKVPNAEHTAGLVQVIETTEHNAFVIVIYACDEVMSGDTLAAFKPESAVTGAPPGIPAYDDAARILFADEGQLVGTARRLVVIDRGQEHGVRPGQRFTLFRRPKSRSGLPMVVGDAVVISVRTDSATIRIEHASDAIRFTDLAAPHRYPLSSIR